MSTIYGLTILMLAICSVTDIKRREISLPAAIAFLIAAILYRGYQGLWWQGFFELFMRFVPGLTMVVLSFFRKEDIGIGDGILVVSTGYILGAVANVYMLLIASIVSGLYSVLMLVLKKIKKGDTLPFVPFMLAGCVLSGIYFAIVKN